MFKYVKGKWGDEIAVHEHEKTIVISSSGSGFTFMHIMDIDQTRELVQHLTNFIELTQKETQ